MWGISWESVNSVHRSLIHLGIELSLSFGSSSELSDGSLESSSGSPFGIVGFGGG